MLGPPQYIFLVGRNYVTGTLFWNARVLPKKSKHTRRELYSSLKFKDFIIQ